MLNNSSTRGSIRWPARPRKRRSESIAGRQMQKAWRERRPWRLTISRARRHTCKELWRLPQEASRLEKNLGATYLREKRLLEARQEFQRVLETQPQDFDSLHNLGRTFLLSDQPEAALGPFEKAALTKPGDPALLIDVLDAQLRLKRADQAAATLAALDRQLGEGDKRRVQIAELLVSQGVYGSASQEFERPRRTSRSRFSTRAWIPPTT